MRFDAATLPAESSRPRRLRAMALVRSPGDRVEAGKVRQGQCLERAIGNGGSELLRLQRQAAGLVIVPELETGDAADGVRPSQRSA